MSTSFQVIVLEALESEATILNTGDRQPTLRVIIERRYSNTGTLHVLDRWEEVVRVDFDFQRRGATMHIDHDPNTVLNGPASDLIYHLTPSDSQETKRLLRYWARRIDEYREEQKARVRRA